MTTHWEVTNLDNVKAYRMETSLKISYLRPSSIYKVVTDKYPELRGGSILVIEVDDDSDNVVHEAWFTNSLGIEGQITGYKMVERFKVNP